MKIISYDFVGGDDASESENKKCEQQLQLPLSLEFQRVNDLRPLLADVPQVKTVVGCSRYECPFIDQKLELKDGRAGRRESGG